MIDSKFISSACSVTKTCGTFEDFGLSHSHHCNNILTFLDNKKYIDVINKNDDIKGIFVQQEYSNLLRDDIETIIVDDPKWFFFSCVHYSAINKVREKSVVSKSAVIHPSAVIAEYGVIIGDNVVIDPNVVVLKDVTICNNVKIRSGAIIGDDGFEHKRTSRGILSVSHNGRVIINEYAEIGSNDFIAKGFSYRDTIIGPHTKIDALVHYAHGVQSEYGCFIAANSTIAGSVTLGDKVWIGPSCSISNRVTIGDNGFVSIGSTVVRNVADGEKVTGNFALPHDIFLKNLMRIIQDN